MTLTIIRGCHLVGSVPLHDSEAVFRQCSAGMPDRLKRIPDGETGVRNWFTFWQSRVFQVSPALMTEFEVNIPIEHRNYTEAEIEEGLQKLKDAGPLSTGYDEVAIESYAVFKRLRDEGVISRKTRFLVCLPTPANVLAPFVQKAFMSKVEPVYEEALHRAMRNIQDKIPHEDLAIQVDLAVDTAFWEGADIYKPWFKDDVKEYTVNYIVRMLEQVDQDVEVGIHNCYGDMAHVHWLEPTSLANVVDRTLRIMDKLPHPLNFVHFPVAKSAIDNLDAYFAPLSALQPKLEEHGTELYLGLVHANDMETTQEMIEKASKVLSTFGVATECGWGRTPPEEIESIMKISTTISQPVY